MPTSNGLTTSPASGSRLYWLAPALSALLVLLPLGMIVASWAQGQVDVWQHLIATQLGTLLTNTVILLVGVSLCVSILGVGLAWLVVSCEFPGRRFLEWALMLPLALPAYVLAFVVLGQWDFMGPVQVWLREGPLPGFGVDVRHPVTVVLVLSAVLYPYVYMLARSAFLSQGSDSFEAARSMGLTPWQAFLRVSVPMARPAIVAGVSLALMETLADFGTVAVFNYDTFTTAIYKAWFGLFNLQAAAQLASLLLLFVFLALGAERAGRGKRRFYQGGRKQHHFRFRIRGWRLVATLILCWGIFIATFVVPVLQLLSWTVESGVEALDARYWSLVRHTLALGGMAAGLVVVLALAMVFSERASKQRFIHFCTALGTMGYALPGSVLAVGVALGLAGVEDTLRLLTGHSETWLVGGIFALLLAYVVRFLAVAHGPLGSSLQQVRPTIPEAARSLGASRWRVLGRVYLPMMRPGLLTAILLVLVDVMKEMPATLLMRPFGWDTLAVRVYEMTSEGEWERAALPALSIVVVGLVPVALSIRQQYTHKR